MHDFMQSLQIRCPVAAAIGLSTQIIASAPTGQPSARSLWNSEIRSSSGQPASVTPNARFLERILAAASRGFFSSKPARARILALLVAPDAVVRLIERADEIGARVGQREAVAPAQSMRRGDLQRLDVVQRDVLDGNEAHTGRACAARGTARRRRCAALPAGVCEAHAA